MGVFHTKINTQHFHRAVPPEFTEAYSKYGGNMEQVAISDRVTYGTAVARPAHKLTQVGADVGQFKINAN